MAKTAREKKTNRIISRQICAKPITRISKKYKGKKQEKCS